MALEPKRIVHGGDNDSAELHDMTRRFWIGAALTLPVFLIAMSHLFPEHPHGSTAIRRVGFSSR